MYIDDILDASRDPVEHELHLRRLLSLLQEHVLKVHPAKCICGVSCIDFLGHRVTKEGTSPSPQKADATEVSTACDRTKIT